MVEYGLVSHLLLWVSVFTLVYWARVLFDALNTYFDGIYFVLQSSFV
jgi:hypothetical protein